LWLRSLPWPCRHLAFGASLIPRLAAAQTPSPTSIALTVDPCDANFNCAAAASATTGQQVKITAHVVYSGTATPSGALCILVDGATANCGLTPASDESWFTPSLAAGADAITATYAGDSNYAASQSPAITLTVSAPSPDPAPTPAPPPAPTPAPAPTVTSTSISVTLSDGFTFTIPAPPAPTIASVSPSSGPTGTAITISGTNFASGATGYLTCPSGSTATSAQFPLATLAVVNTTTIAAGVPSGPPAGPCDVTISNP
jgi:Bacterial Ig-like domain (group 3)/IPT/TIG domain